MEQAIFRFKSLHSLRVKFKHFWYSLYLLVELAKMQSENERTKYTLSKNCVWIVSYFAVNLFETLFL